MTESERKSGLFVVPGDRLGVIEEFTSGTGTYIEEGTIHSKITGYTLLDMLNKEVSVFPLVKTLPIPRVGSIVTGLVTDVKSKNAVLTIFQVDEKKLSGTFNGMLHISSVSHGFVENMFDVAKPGDVMRAKVISTKNRSIFLSTVDRNLGILSAICSLCGSNLMHGDRGLKCSNCGNIENRKISPDYGKISIQEDEKIEN